MPINQLFKNNAKTKLAAAINDSVTSLTVTTGAGELFPNPSGSQYFIATLQETGVGVEIVKVTARSADTFTVIRNQESSGAKAFTTAADIYISSTADWFSCYSARFVYELDNTGQPRIRIGSGDYQYPSGFPIDGTNRYGIDIGLDNFAAYGANVIGWQSKASGYLSNAIGFRAYALGAYSSAIGYSTSKSDFTVSFNNLGMDRLASPSIQSPMTMGESAIFPSGGYGYENTLYCGMTTRFMTEPIDLCGGVTWTTATAYNHGRFVKPTAPNGKMYARYDYSYPFDDAATYISSTGGIIEPTWPTTALAIVDDDQTHGAYICINPANYAIAFADKFVCEGIDILVYNLSGITGQATIDIGTQASGTLLKSGHVTNLTAQWELEKIAITPRAIDDLKINITTMATGTELLVRFVVHGYYVKHWL